MYYLWDSIVRLEGGSTHPFQGQVVLKANMVNSHEAFSWIQSYVLSVRRGQSFVIDSRRREVMVAFDDDCLIRLR